MVWELDLIPFPPSFPALPARLSLSIPIPALCPHFLVPVPSPIYLVSSQLPSPPAPPAPHHCFLLLHLPPDSSSCWPRCSNEAVSSLSLPGEVIWCPESQVLAPHAGAWSGCWGVAAAGSRGLAQGWGQHTCGRPGPQTGLALPKVGKIPMGNPKHPLATKIAFPTDLKALFQNIWACTKKNKPKQENSDIFFILVDAIVFNGSGWNFLGKKLSVSQTSSMEYLSCIAKLWGKSG